MTDDFLIELQDLAKEHIMKAYLLGLKHGVENKQIYLEGHVLTPKQLVDAYNDARKDLSNEQTHSQKGTLHMAPN